MIRAVTEWSPPNIPKFLPAYFLFPFFMFSHLKQWPKLCLGSPKQCPKLSPVGGGPYPISRDSTILTSYLIWCSLATFNRAHVPCLLSIILITSLQLLPIQDHALPSNYEILICLHHLVEVRKDKEAAICIFTKSEDISSFSLCQGSVHLSASHSMTLIVDCFKISVASCFHVKRWSGHDNTHGFIMHSLYYL